MPKARNSNTTTVHFVKEWLTCKLKGGGVQSKSMKEKVRKTIKSGKLGL